MIKSMGELLKKDVNAREDTLQTSATAGSTALSKAKKLATRVKDYGLPGFPMISP